MINSKKETESIVRTGVEFSAEDSKKRSTLRFKDASLDRTNATFGPKLPPMTILS